MAIVLMMMVVIGIAGATRFADLQAFVASFGSDTTAETAPDVAGITTVTIERPTQFPIYVRNE